MKFHEFKIIIRFFFILILFIGGLIFFSCDDSLKFKNPQPHNKKNINEIPSQLIGWWASADDSAVIQMKSRCVLTYEYQYRDDFNPKQLNEVKIDTLFDLDSDVIRKYKGHYYFNKFDKDEMYWEVSKLIIQQDSLIFNIVYLKDTAIDELKKLLAIETVLKADDKLDYYICDPSKKEWKKLNKGNYFSHPYFSFFKIQD